MQRSSSVLAGDKMITPGTEKENPPAATGGSKITKKAINQNHDFAKVFALFLQARKSIEQITDWYERLRIADREGDAESLLLTHKDQIFEDWSSAWPIYQSGYTDFIRHRFMEISGKVNFDFFEDRMIELGCRLAGGSPGDGHENLHSLYHTPGDFDRA